MRKRIKIFQGLRHALRMVGRTWKSYALLSVTIVLSFSLLLGYLTLSDSEIYNEYKQLFSDRRQDVAIWIGSADTEKALILADALSAMDNTTYYFASIYHLGHIATRYAFEIDGELIELVSPPAVTGCFLPEHSWQADVDSYYIRDRQQDIVWLDGQKHQFFSLEADQVIVTEALYQLLQMDQQEEPVFLLNLQYGQKIPLRVAGYCKDYTCEIWQTMRIDWPHTADSYLFNLLLSNKFVDYAQIFNDEYYENDYMYKPRLHCLYLHVYSETPEAVLSLIESMNNTDYTATYELQNAALDEIRPQKQTKAIITCALLLLLGINLYSSFTNAMNDRKYEIGIKRAVGASAFSIVRQFLYESIIVMLANILVSIALVADVAIIYKYIVEHTPDEFGVYPDYILYISPYSVAMFATCAVTLTVVFSLIFAYKSTRVEIVQYLKAE